MTICIHGCPLTGETAQLPFKPKHKMISYADRPFSYADKVKERENVGETFEEFNPILGKWFRVLSFDYWTDNRINMAFISGRLRSME